MANRNHTHHIMTAQQKHVSTIAAMWQCIDNALDTERPFGGDSDNKIDYAKSLIEHALRSDKALVLIAVAQEQVIGTISGHMFEKPAVNTPQVGVIYSLWVEQDHRKQGVGKQLLEKLELSLRQKGAQAFQVGWDTGNTIANLWWQKRGYCPYEVIASKMVQPL